MSSEVEVEVDPRSRTGTAMAEKVASGALIGKLSAMASLFFQVFGWSPIRKKV